MAERWNVHAYSDLYQTASLLSAENRQALGLTFPVDVYVQDPFVARRNPALDINTIHLPCEPEMMDGPTSARIAVVDYNADTDTLSKPARWDPKTRRFVYGDKKNAVPLAKEHRDTPQFHQVNAWAIIQSVLEIYEQTWVLGRSAPWAFEGNRLMVVPHAGWLRNAYYDRHSKSIQLYYFDRGGEWVYTCLSHDIITHETGHAILDGLRPYYLEDTSLQTTAFHEFVADLTAIITALLNTDLRGVVTEESADALDSKGTVAGLAEEFGEFAMDRPHLRSAQNPRTIPSVLDNSSPYDWSEVLTGAMFEILAGMYEKRRNKPVKGGRIPSRKEALWWALARFRRVALQPLDYLPPVDVQFKDYACAVLRADELVDPLDEDDYRGLIRDVFTRRGIDYVADEEWPHFYGYDIQRLARSRTDAYHFLNENRRQLCIPAEQDISVANLYQTDKTVLGGRKLPREVVVQYIWREDVPLQGTGLESLGEDKLSLLCGGTLVFDDRGNLLSWLRKPGTGRQETGRRLRSYCRGECDKGENRRKQLIDYVTQRVDEGYVGLRRQGEPAPLEAQKPVVATAADDGTLRLEVVPGMRHWAAS